MWHSIKIGLFIGVTTASAVIFFLRIIPMTPLIMMGILYLYAIVGGLTAFYVHEKLNRKNKNIKVKVKQEPKSNPSFGIKQYASFLNDLNEIKTTALMVENIIETKKRLDELKSESNDLLELSLDKMNTGISSFSHEVLSAKVDSNKS